MLTISMPSSMVTGLKENRMCANEPSFRLKLPDTLARPEIVPPSAPDQPLNRNVPLKFPVWSSNDR